VDGGADHRDGCQMFTDGDAFSLVNMTIQRNKFLADTDINRPYRDYFQGYSFFLILFPSPPPPLLFPELKYTPLLYLNVSFRIDGFDVPLYDVVVANNLIVTSTYHGVSLYSSINAIVIGNTMLDPTGAYVSLSLALHPLPSVYGTTGMLYG
jgi:parallel beta-helix repeat protein